MGVFSELLPKEVRILGLRTAEELAVKGSIKAGCNAGEEITPVSNTRDDLWEKWRVNKDEATVTERGFGK